MAVGPSQVAGHEARAAAGRAGRPLRLSITLHGVTRTLAALPRVAHQADGLTATGTLQLRQTDLGVTPMSVMAGAMTVADTMELRYRIVARAPRQSPCMAIAQARQCVKSWHDEHSPCP